MSVTSNDKQYIAGTYARSALEVSKGTGSNLVSFDGKEYIDLSAGIAVNTFGIADAEWVKAVSEQAEKIQHISNLYYTKPQTDLAKMLCEKTGLCKVFFSNSGAEANECAIKTARKYSFDKYGEGRHTVITLKNSFHGRTITTLSATGQDTYHTVFNPFTEGFVYAEANNIEDLKEKIEQNNCCAFMFEPIQGEGGVNCLDEEYLQEAAKICGEKDILLIADEVQTGNGRTGKYFGYMHSGINPDIVSTAKGLAGGLPMGATLFGEKTKDVLTPGTHGSTFGGNPVCAAGAISIVSRIDQTLLDNVTRKGDLIKSMILGAKGVEDVTGKGLMLGVKTTRPAKDVVAECLEKGVVVLTAKDKVRLLPPLNITDEQIEKAMKIIIEVCGKEQ